MVLKPSDSTESTTFDNPAFSTDHGDIDPCHQNGLHDDRASSSTANADDAYEAIESKTPVVSIKSQSPDNNNIQGQIAEDDRKPDTEEEESEGFQNRCWQNIYSVTGRITSFCTEHHTFISYSIYAFMLCLYAAYLIYACIYDFDEAFVILIITAVTVFCVTYGLVRDTKGEQIYEHILEPLWNGLVRGLYRAKWIVLVVVLVGFAVCLYFLTRENPIQLVSFAGLVFFILFLYVFSKYPDRVKWRPVVWGLALQFIFGLLILRTYPGYVLFQWIGDVVQKFLGYSAAGSEFLFGEDYNEHYFAFAVLPIVLYFSSAIAILYYWGVMQVVIEKIAWLMQRTMRTSASESLNAAGNIFIGQTEAPLLIRPFLKDMTRSEIHAVMTGGFATIAGSVLGAYVLSGISAAHLVSASVMSAPAALAVSKLFYPETEKSATANCEDIVIEKGSERNFVEAASNGASMAIPLVLNIAANLIAFLSLLALVNALLGYFGGLVGYPELTFELICSYVFMPLAFIMGVEWSDCRKVAELIGIKTFVNEFVAYDELAKLIENRENGLEPSLSLRSEVIATYALCGFANIGSIGIQLGGLTPLAPEKRADLAAVAIRALVAGTIACFMTACIAGVLYVPEEVLPTNSTTPIPMTTIY